MKNIVVLIILLIADILFISFKTNHTKINLNTPQTDSFSFSRKDINDLVVVPHKKKVKVMIIDTKIQENHDYLSMFFKGKNTNIETDHAHGTHVAGILAQRLSEAFGKNIYKNVDFVSCSYYDSKNNMENNKINLLNCFQKALNQKVDIINLSGGGYGFFDKEFEIMAKLNKSGIIVVTSSGNEGIYTEDYFPCNYGFKNIYCVGSNHKNIRSSTSNYGPNVAFLAEGENIVSAIPDQEKNLVGSMSGTSQATAQVSAFFIAKMIDSKKSELIIEKANISISNNFKSQLRKISSVR